MGFVACGINESTKIPELKISGVSFSHLNLSTHQLNETKVIDITSSIVLDIQNSIKLKNHSQTESRCSNSYLKVFSGFSKIENSQRLPVKDILPPEAFTPTSNPQSELYCDFKIEVFNGNQKIALILLDDIHITNIENHSNFQLPLKGFVKDPAKALYIQKKDIKDLKLVMPLDKGEILTLCEASGKTRFFNGQVLPMADLFDQELFEEKSLSLCRLVAYQKTPSKIWVSVPFYFQSQEPRITYQYRHNYKAMAMAMGENHWEKENMGVLSLFNQGSTVVYLQIPALSTKVSVAGVYSYQNTNINYKSQVPDLNAWWTVDQGLLVKKGDDKSPGVYKLEPGMSMSLSLNTHDSFKCSSEKYIFIDGKQQTLPPLRNGEVPGNRKFFDCRGFYSFSGALYHLHEFPKITYNLFETMDHQKWQPLHLEKLLHRQYGEEFSQWVPNYEVVPACLKETLENFPVESENKELIKCE